MPPNYVNAAPEISEQQPEMLTAQSVGAVVLGNLGAGFGAAVVVQVLAVWFGVDAMGALPWAMGVGCLFFGGLSVVRLGMDEVATVWEWRQMVAELEAMAAENVALRDRVKSLEQDINHERQMRAVHARVPAPGRVSVAPQGDSIRRDAETLLQRKFMDVPFARDVMTQNGWTPTRWNEAMELLKAAGIAATNGKRTVIQVQTFAEATDRLNRVREE